MVSKDRFHTAEENNKELDMVKNIIVLVKTKDLDLSKVKLFR